MKNYPDLEKHLYFLKNKISTIKTYPYSIHQSPLLSDKQLMYPMQLIKGFLLEILKEILYMPSTATASFLCIQTWIQCYLIYKNHISFIK